MKAEHQPKTGQRCGCKPGIYRDNCSVCEGTGWKVDFARIRVDHKMAEIERLDNREQELIGHTYDMREEIEKLHTAAGEILHLLKEARRIIKKAGNDYALKEIEQAIAKAEGK